MTSSTPPRRELQVLLVLLAFTGLVIFLHGRLSGEDLASSFVGCRLVAAGRGAHLYSHSPRVFSNVGDPVWAFFGAMGRFRPVELLHPYVQTPLWAYALQPLCTPMDFPQFLSFFVVLTTVSMAAILWIAARYWAPTMMHPLLMTLACALLSVSEPFRYALYLMQTHVLFLLLSVLAIVLAEKDKPVLAGMLLALAAAVKITPGFLLVYWLITRRNRAALSFVISSVLLLAATLLLTGTALFQAYLRELSEVSNVLLVSFNVQSLAAVVTGPHFGAWELLDWKTHKLPFVLKFTSMLLTLASAVAGGWLDRRRAGQAPAGPPYGAIFTLIGVTMFTPIAWDHYYLLMVLPVMLLLDRRLLSRGTTWIFVAGIVGLNLYPVRFGLEHHWLGHFALVRSQWYSGVLALVALWLLRQRSVLRGDRGVASVAGSAQAFA